MRGVICVLILCSLCFCASSKVVLTVTVMTPGRTALDRVIRQAISPYDYSDDDEVDYSYEQQPTQDCKDMSWIDQRLDCFLDKYRFYPWSYVYAKSALDIAMKNIRAKGITGHFNINLQFRDCGDEHGQASTTISQIASVDAKMVDDMAVMIGPMDSYSTSRVAVVTKHWNILNISPRSISPGLRRTDHEGNTLVRTGPSVSTEVGNCISSMLSFYEWNKNVVEVFEDDLHERTNYFIAEGIYEQIIASRFEDIVNQVRLSEFPHEDIDNAYDYSVVLMSVREFGRVIILSGVADVVREFMIHAESVNYDNKEFAYIVIDIDNKLGKKPWIWPEAPDERNRNSSAMKRQLESALIVRAKRHNNEEFEKYVESMVANYGSNLTDKYNRTDVRAVIEKIAQRTSDGRDFQMKNFFQDNIYPALLYDTLLMAATVVNKSIEHHLADKYGDDHNYTEAAVNDILKQAVKGKNLMKEYICGQSFQGITGPITMDENCDRKTDFEVLDLNPETDEFEVVGEFDSRMNTYQELKGKKSIWPSGSPPPDVPKCGFAGRRCPKQRITVTEAVVISIVSFAVIVTILSITAYRKYKLAKELQSQLWRVLWCDITWLSDATQNLGNGPIPGVFGGESTDYVETPQCARRNLLDLGRSDLSIAEVMSLPIPPMTPTIPMKRSKRSKIFRSRKWSNRVDDAEHKTSCGSLISEKNGGSCTVLGMYKGKLVTIKITNKKKLELTRNLQMELKHMRDITHDHLTRFEGACVDPPRIGILTEFCPKGSLRDILLNEEIQLAWMFKYSLMNDVVKGMSFLHGSAIHSHGNLKSTNCVVDSRFVLKITDYGLDAFRSTPSYDDFDSYYAKKLWTAPELQRCATPPPKGTQQGDVYSFGVILHEIALRKGTFYVEGTQMCAKEICDKVRKGYFPYFRPYLDRDSLSDGFSHLLQRCWSEDPSERPDFNELKDIIKRFNKGNPGNLLDSLLSRMEQYASNLEGLVEERTAAYLEEKKKADDLLYQMLPVPVVQRLKLGDSVPAEAYESVTIFFSDIVGFTTLSATSTPMQVVDMLNDLYTCFDATIDSFDVYKVETIGDAYMLVSGLPERNGIRHAAEIARTSLALLRTVSNFKIRHRQGEQLKLRIGIHSGIRVQHTGLPDLLSSIKPFL